GRGRSAALIPIISQAASACAKIWQSYLFLSIVALLAFAAGATCAQAAPGNFRRPADDAELRYWLQNMVWYHRFSTAEIGEATGSAQPDIDADLKRFDTTPETRPNRPA